MVRPACARTQFSASRRVRDRRGMVTAETAVALPVLLLVTVALAWLLAVGVAQLRCIDAARDAARMIARDDSAGAARARAEAVAPPGAVVDIEFADGIARVRVRYRADPPSGLLEDVVGIDLVATSEMPVEQDDATP